VLPPGPRPQDEDAGLEPKRRPNSRLRPFLLAALAASVAVLVLLTALPRPSESAAPTGYPVTIAVAPEGLRPVLVTVVSSPPGSALQPGGEIRNVPGQVELERGEWVLKASYLDRTSPDLRFTVPEQRTVTVVIAP
jgi:hypothetical protein